MYISLRKGLAFLSICIAGCGSTATRQQPRTPRTQHVEIGRKCMGLTTLRAAPDGAFGRVFVEAADVTRIALPEQTGELPEDRILKVEAVQVAGVLAQNEMRSTVPWSVCQGPECAREVNASSWMLTFTPQLPEQSSETIRLANVALREPGDSGASHDGRDVNTHDQRTAIVTLQPPGSDAVSRIAFTPYLIADDDDLRGLFECKKDHGAGE